jgi:hypothetical protein
MLYLSGATHNHFTGSSWTTTLREGDIHTDGLYQGHFEMLENTIALIRGSEFITGVRGLYPGLLRTQFSQDMIRDLHVNDFAVAAVYTDEITMWLDNWMDENPTFGQAPVGYAIGRVRYYWHTYLPMRTVSIIQGRNRTGTIFRPPASGRMWFDENSTDYAENMIVFPSGDKRADGFMGRNTVYHHHFMHVNPQLTFVQDILRESHVGLYAERLYAEREVSFSGPAAERTVQRHYGTVEVMLEERPLMTTHEMETLISDYFHHHLGVTDAGRDVGTRRDLQGAIDVFSVDTLAAYAESVRTHFMYVPDSVPQRVHDLTNQIIRTEETDFDRIMAIRDFLLTNFPYTLDPAPVPYGTCFVDYFLFVGQEGYCTYFASAMAIMARIAGVPSRYVEGFFVSGTGRHDYAMSVVTNRMAHAWVEVYFEGFGWLNVEATPTHSIMLNGGISSPQRLDAISWDDTFLESDMWLEDYMQWNPDGNIGGNRPVAGAASGEAEAVTAIQLIIYFSLAGLLILTVAVLLFLLVCRIRFFLAVARIKSFCPNHQALAYFRGILSISEYYHTSMHKGETTLAYGKRAGKRFAFRSDAVFLRDLIALYNRARYGHRRISNADLAMMKESYSDMVKLLREMRTPPHYLFLRYIKKIGVLHTDDIY